MDSDQEALEKVKALIQQLLPASWLVEAEREVALIAPLDGLWKIVPPKGPPEVIGVEFRRSLGPSAAIKQRERTRSGQTIGSGIDTLLVAAPWLPSATQGVLRDQGIAFADATGNVDLSLKRLPVVLRTRGAQRNPRPREPGKVGLGGEAALALVRQLVDFAPPYTLTELAAACDLSLGYVSRLTTSLEELGLIRRDRAGIKQVEWAELLRERARQGPPLLRPGRYDLAVARRGLPATIAALRDVGTSLPVCVTGSFAAQYVEPTAEAAQLALWTEDAQATRKALALLPAKKGGNVVLLSPTSKVVKARSKMVDGLRLVAVSQLALDCLSGNGRLPAEGEEILKWMGRNEDKWRVGAFAIGSSGIQEGRPDRPSSTKSWTQEALDLALTRLEAGSGQTQALVVRKAARNGGEVSREEVYQLAGYPPTRSLRGFTRPVNRITNDLQDAGWLSAKAPPLLRPIYDTSSNSFQSAQGFLVPAEVVQLLGEPER